MVAALFLLARRRRTRQWAEIALLLFVATTYVLAPVIGFGWVLLLLGLAQTSFSTRVAHVLYPALFIGIPVFIQTDEMWRIAKIISTVTLPF